MKTIFPLVIAAVAVHASASDIGRAEEKIAYCAVLANQVASTLSSPPRRSQAMRWVRIGTRYIEVLEQLGLSPAQTRLLLDQAEKRADEENERIRGAPRPLSAAIESFERTFAECDGLAAPRQPR